MSRDRRPAGLPALRARAEAICIDSIKVQEAKVDMDRSTANTPRSRGMPNR